MYLGCGFLSIRVQEIFSNRLVNRAITLISCIYQLSKSGISIIGLLNTGNPSSQLSGVLGSSPYHRRGLGTPFFVGKSRILRPPLVNKDLEEGISFGVPVIPTFFINGCLMVGA